MDLTCPNSDWIGQSVRDIDGVPGKITGDSGPGITRYLDMTFADGRTHTVKLCGWRDNPPDPLASEWEYNHGKWARLAK